MESKRVVPHPPERVFGFLSDLHNHWQLEDAFIEVDGVRDSSGRICIRGPLGISREALTTVIESREPSLLRGRAEIGEETVGLVTWRIDPAPGGSLVRLAAAVERASAIDRILLALGGRRWLSRRFARVLETLAARLAA